MKKVRVYFAFCMILILIFGACGTAQKGNGPTGVPETTKAPEDETPEVTAPAEGTDNDVTESPAPKPTEPPTATSVATVTEMPKSTEVPTPTAKPTPTKIPAISKAPEPKYVAVTYDMNDLKYFTSYGLKYTVDGDGAITATFESIYSEILLKLPKQIAMEDCEKIVVRVKSEEDTVAVKFYGTSRFTEDNGEDYFAYWECKGDGVKEYEIRPIDDRLVAGIGMMSMAEGKSCTATIYDVTFYVEETQREQLQATPTPRPTATPKPTVTPYPKADVTQGDICYTADELEVLAFHGAECVRQSGKKELFRFTGQYGQVRLLLPEAVDSEKCIAVGIKLKAGTTWLGVSFYREGFHEAPYGDAIESYIVYTNIKESVEEQTITIPNVGDVCGIGLMYCDDPAVTGVYEAVLENVTFYMSSGNEIKVPKEIAPDVTGDMTLLNTYGTEFGRVGAGITLAELQNPAVLQEIRKHYNSVTSRYEAKQDNILQNPAVFISVEEARKLGYIIPSNYKETVVPKFRFDVLDETLKICAENGLGYRFHTLMWHEQCLDWFFREGYSEQGNYVSPQVMDARMEFYIRTVMEHVYNSEYGHVVYAWDVLNEHLHANEYNSSWVRVYKENKLQPKFLKRAYTIADDVLRKHGIREKVSLILNDYNTYSSEFTQDIITVLDYLNADKKVCDGVGMQSHPFAEDVLVGRYKEAILAFLDAGYEVQVTETGVNIRNKNEIKVQEERYYELMKIWLEVIRDGGNITGVTFWGVSDSGSGSEEFAPFLFTHPGRPKELYYKMLQLYQNLGSYR